ncbi:MAG TPA: molybdopterin-dependent oxidoreductase [Gaiellaceae bacterium]|nr:molybdopterin-dependent oxidoreductase [Gaiellaceae bacterium]
MDAPANESLDALGQHPRRIGRGVFLATVLGGASSLFWGKAAWSRVSDALGGAERLVPLVPTTGWRIYTVANTMPTFDPDTWRLGVGGLVRQPMSIDYDQLRSLPRHEQISDFHCVTGWTVEHVHWAGVRLSDFLERVAPLPEAHGVEFVSAEKPYVDSLTLPQARLRRVMLAYEMDGRPLSREHGAPLRLVIPQMYGYKGVKWISQINLVTKPQPGYWEQLGYDVDAWVGRSNNRPPLIGE